MYSNSCCNGSFEPEIIKIGLSTHKMYSNNILNFQKSTTIFNACTKKSGKLLNAPRNLSVHMHLFQSVCLRESLCAYIYNVCVYVCEIL